MSAIEATLIHGYAPSHIRYNLQNVWEISPVIRARFSRYYLLYWSPEHFFKCLHDGIVEHFGIKHQVIYYKCTPESIRSCRQLQLSFREAHPDYGIEPYVLVMKGAE